ncbi:MAG: hypothetical protein KAI66_13150 [Lentisphaeria bacterium]|nr:hypothetical protein [Lentisphaeria bacterium]
MTIGIGGAGGKIATVLDPGATLVNVSETELNKLPETGRRILAVVHDARGQFRGSRKNPVIGRDAYQSVRRELLGLIQGTTVFSSTGGGTGNGITASLLEELAKAEDIPPVDKTRFALILPFANMEPAEFTRNTIDFLQNPLSAAIDSGTTGNIFLFSNRLKFESRLREDRFNAMIADSLKVFEAVPDKNDELVLLDGHIDHEDFELFTGRPYFNHFTYFDYDPESPFGDQLEANANPLLLRPETPIETLFLLEVPSGGDPTILYDILAHFIGIDVSPVYSVVENPNITTPFITVSLLYSRKPAELLDDFNHISEAHTRAKVKKSLEQHVALPRLEVSMTKEAARATKERGDADDVLQVLRRIGKL